MTKLLCLIFILQLENKAARREYSCNFGITRREGRNGHLTLTGHVINTKWITSIVVSKDVYKINVAPTMDG